MQNVIVFARTKHGADKIAKDLNKSGIVAEAIHGDKSQNARQRALSNFKRNETRVLVATDIAARGIDIVDLPFVINYELPETAETYTHRIGRTGRAGQAGAALSFCDREERDQLNSINRIATSRLTVVEHPFN
jgi:ATP-dependent RNA helicase RhlE